MRELFLVLFSWAAVAGAIAAEPVIPIREQIEELLPHRDELPVLERCLALGEEALSLAPGDPDILVLLAQLWHEHAVLVEGGKHNGSQRLASLKKAADHACRAMGLDSYLPLERMTVSQLEEHLAGVNNPGALLWAGDSWGKILADHQLHAFRVGSVSKLRLLYGRLVEVDEHFFGAAGHRSLGALEANVSLNTIARWMFGGTVEQARAHLERALELAPEYLMNYIEYANHLAGPRNEWELFDGLLHYVLQAPLEPVPLWNALAKQDARRLLEEKGRPLPSEE